MEIRNRKTGELKTVSQFRALYPNTSFPKQITAEILDAYGYDPVLNGPAAITSGPYETSVRDGVEEINGQWFTKYVVGPIFKEYTDEDGVVHNAEGQKAAYEKTIDDRTAQEVRSERNARLSATDWTVLTDAPLTSTLKTQWKQYRKSLRDLPVSEGFPHTIAWPKPPA